jgi:hypothetical protein
MWHRRYLYYQQFKSLPRTYFEVEYVRPGKEQGASPDGIFVSTPGGISIPAILVLDLLHHPPPPAATTPQHCTASASDVVCCRQRQHRLHPLSAKAPATYATAYAAQSAQLDSHGRSSLLIVIALGLSADNIFPPVVAVVFLLHHLLLAATMNRV